MAAPMASLECTCLDRVAGWLGCVWTDGQRHAFERYADWLTTEGIDSGGIGPAESSRIWDRHVCDALTFGHGLTTVRSLIDVGSGVGLPGIPLAIAFPHLEIVLVERSGRRADALNRVTAMLGVDATVIHADVAQVVDRADRVVFRASLRLEEAIHWSGRLLTHDGEAWFGLGRGAHPKALARWRTAPPPAPGLTISEVHVPVGILDSDAWLLRMTAT